MILSDGENDPPMEYSGMGVFTENVQRHQKKRDSFPLFSRWEVRVQMLQDTSGCPRNAPGYPSLIHIDYPPRFWKHALRLENACPV